MVKINLLDVPEGKGKPRKNKPQNADFNTQSSEIDFSFFQPQQETPSQSATEDTTTRQQKSFTEQENFRSDYDAPASFDNVYSRRRILLYFGIGIVILVAILLGLLLVRSNDTAEKGPAVVQDEAPAGEEQTVQPNNLNRVPAILQRQYSDNQSANLNNLNLANQILNTRAVNTSLSLVVVAPDHLYLSVLGNSRDDIAEFRRILKERIPSIRLNIEGTEDRYISGEKKLLASFSTPISPSGSAQPLSQIEVIDAAHFQSSLRSLVQRHNLQITYFKQGDQERDGNFRKTYFYLNVQGTQSLILKYLEEMSQNYPAIHFFKISLYPSSANTMSGGTIIARLELIFYAPSSA